MKSTWTLNENSTGKLVVEVEPKAWQEAQEKALNTLVKNVEIEGFRKGHAPKKLAAKHVSQQQVMMDAINEVANAAYESGIIEHKIEPVTQPALDVESMTPEALTLVFDVTVKPEVELGEYKGIKVEAQDIVVTDEDVDAELKKLQEDNAEFVVQEEGVIENGNTVVIDFEGFKDGVAFEGGKGENYNLEIGSNSFIPGFEEALIGLKSGDVKDIDLSFPENYHVEELAGQPVVFNVKINEVKVRQLPEINDDLVAYLEDESLTTLDDLKSSIIHDLTHRREHEEEDRVNEQLVNVIIENAKVDVPQAMIDEELNQMINEFKQRLSQQGMSFEIYSQILNQTEEDVREQMKDDADKRVRTRLVLEKIAEVESLKADEEDIDKEYQSISEMYGIELEQVKQIVSVEAVTYELLLRKSLELVQSTRV